LNQFEQGLSSLFKPLVGLDALVQRNDFA